MQFSNTVASLHTADLILCMYPEVAVRHSCDACLTVLSLLLAEASPKKSASPFVKLKVA